VNQTLPLTSPNGSFYYWNCPYGIYAGMLATVIWPATNIVTTPAIVSNIYYQETPPPTALIQNIVNKDGSLVTIGQFVIGTASLLFYDGNNWRALA
jgi:hypothetical protein